MSRRHERGDWLSILSTGDTRLFLNKALIARLLALGINKTRTGGISIVFDCTMGSLKQPPNAEGDHGYGSSHGHVGTPRPAHVLGTFA